MRGRVFNILTAILIALIIAAYVVAGLGLISGGGK